MEKDLSPPETNGSNAPEEKRMIPQMKHKTPARVGQGRPAGQGSFFEKFEKIGKRRAKKARTPLFAGKKGWFAFFFPLEKSASLQTQRGKTRIAPAHFAAPQAAPLAVFSVLLPERLANFRPFGFPSVPLVFPFENTQLPSDPFGFCFALHLRHSFFEILQSSIGFQSSPFQAPESVTPSAGGPRRPPFF